MGYDTYAIFKSELSAFNSILLGTSSLAAIYIPIRDYRSMIDSTFQDESNRENLQRADVHSCSWHSFLYIFN